MFESVRQLFVALVGIGGNELTVPPVAAAAPAPEELSTSQLVERIAAAERLVHALQAVQGETSPRSRGHGWLLTTISP